MLILFILKDRILRKIRWWISPLSAMIKNPTLRAYQGSRIFHTTFGENVSIFENTHIYSSVIGNYTYIQSGGIIHNCTIGSYCSIAEGVRIALGRHPIRESLSTNPNIYSANVKVWGDAAHPIVFEENLSVNIGSDVYIGARVTILDGVKIGHGAVIGASALVTKDVGPYEIVGGVPAKLIGKRFSDKQIEMLLLIEWWNHPKAWITENYNRICSDLNQ